MATGRDDVYKRQDQDLKDGMLFQPVPESAFLMNGLMRQTAYWLRYVKY